MKAAKKARFTAREEYTATTRKLAEVQSTLRVTLSRQVRELAKLQAILNRVLALDTAQADTLKQSAFYRDVLTWFTWWAASESDTDYEKLTLARDAAHRRIMATLGLPVPP
jgi:hypothetical protein